MENNKIQEGDILVPMTITTPEGKSFEGKLNWSEYFRRIKFEESTQRNRII